jgi:hypothetical protein
MKFDFIEGYLILEALDEYSEYHLPRSMSRKTLYNLIKKFLDGLGIECDDGYSIPNIFHDKFDESKSFDLDLDEDEIDFIKRAVQVGNFLEASGDYPKDIREAAIRVYERTYEALRETPEFTPENEELFERIFRAIKETS